MVQCVKDSVLSLQWPGNFHMLQAWPKKKKMAHLNEAFPVPSKLLDTPSPPIPPTCFISLIICAVLYAAYLSC